MTNTQPQDWSWTTPNRRYLHLGIYLPGIYKENAPPIGIIVDTSGSVDDATLAVVGQAISEINQEVRPERIEVVYCDTQVRNVQTFTADDEVKLAASGGGGTDMEPAFRHFNESDDPPAAVLCITDGYMSWPDEPTGYDTLWAITPGSSVRAAPWGRSMRVDPHS